MSNADDFAAISMVKARYCRFLDTKDWAAYTDLFTEDFILDTSTAGGAPPVHGREDAITYIRSCVEHAKTAHHVHNPEITIEGDTAQVIWAMQDRVIWPEDRAARLNESGHTGFGQYHAAVPHLRAPPPRIGHAILNRVLPRPARMC